MTPSEKKAREIFGSVMHHTVEEEVWRIADAIEVAERRGFERAKGACIEKAKIYRYYAVKGVPTSNKIIYELENLKYEEA